MSEIPNLDPLDHRLNAYRPDLAEVSLKGKVSADRFVKGVPARIAVAFTDMRNIPDPACGLDTQLLYGERVQILERQDKWLWVKKEVDGYVGWIDAHVVDDQTDDPTHMVCVPRTFFYPSPDLKLPHKGIRSIGSLLNVVDEVEVRGTPYSILATGEVVVSRHIRLVGSFDQDYVGVAESLLGTPYLWAGTTAFGLDCSGFVQLAMRMAGQNVLRDSDMQAATIGGEIDPGGDHENLQRGDLVFWRGHVGICQGEGMMIHANAHTMNVTSEPLEEAVSRIAYLYEKPIGFRRPG